MNISQIYSGVKRFREPLVVSALALVRDRRLLMVVARGRDVLYLPGGKVEPDETGEAAAIREAREEVSVELDPHTVSALFTVTEQAHGEPDGRLVQMTVFTGVTSDEPRPASEVGSISWVTTADAHRCPPAGVETLRRMSSLGLID